MLRTIHLSSLGLLVLAALSSACSGVSYVWQGAAGQLDLWSSAKDIDDVLVDPATTQETRELLEEVRRIRTFAAAHGLRFDGNYEQYVAQEDRHPEFVVWFVNASEPLSFEPKVFWFPIVGSFPGLGYWHEQDANEFAAELREEGWDVNVRGVRAFSTGGWFEDPVLWTMFADSENAYGYLVNVLLHESVHATVLVPNQQYFNESLASFVADQMTPQYLTRRFGQDSSQLKVYQQRYRLYREQTALMLAAFGELERLYLSDVPAAVKLDHKRKVYAKLAAMLEAKAEVNNATLVGIQLYQGAPNEFQQLFEACEQGWPRFLHAVGGLQSEHFAEEQSPEFGPVLTQLAQSGCEAPAAPLPHSQPLLSKPLREQRERERRRSR